MAGHSKWANIRFRKAAQDARRGKLFTRLIREIVIAARDGGGDAASNPRLRAAVDKARDANLGRDAIDRAIKRGTGEVAGERYEEVRYEGYAAGGAAVLVECATDNRNRTTGEVRLVFSKHGGNLGASGSVAYLFNKVGLLSFDPGSDVEGIMDIAAAGGADDIADGDGDGIEVLTAPENFHAVLDALKRAGHAPAAAGIVYRAGAVAEVGAADAERVTQLLSALEELDDVQDVFTNAALPAP